jgi:nucleoid-associated protein YgaU
MSQNVRITFGVRSVAKEYLAKQAEQSQLSLAEQLRHVTAAASASLYITDRRAEGAESDGQYRPIEGIAEAETPPAVFAPYGPLAALDWRGPHKFEGTFEGGAEESITPPGQPPVIELLPNSNPGAYWTHIVAAGDTLSSIASFYYSDGSRYPRIAQANNLSAPYTIYINQTLNVPKPDLPDSEIPRFTTACSVWVTYLVRSGDNLGSIASAHYGNSGEYWRIAHCNNIPAPNYVIYVNQSLNIPPRLV